MTLARPKVVREMFVGLTRDDEQTVAILPGMAESLDIAEDGRAYTFHLRSGIPWVAWDGSSVVEVRDCQDPPAIRMVTAEDFVYGIKVDIGSRHRSELRLRSGERH